MHARRVGCILIKQGVEKIAECSDILEYYGVSREEKIHESQSMRVLEFLAHEKFCKLFRIWKFLTRNKLY